MPNLRAAICSVVASAAALPTRACPLRIRARAPASPRGCGNRCRNGVDVLLQGGDSRAVRIGFMRELDHVVQQIPPRIDEVELALQLRCLRLQGVTLLGFRAGDLSLRGCDLGLEFWSCELRDRVRLCAAPAARSTPRPRPVLHLRFAAQELRVRARNLERERNDTVCSSPVGIKDQQVARLRGGLLLDAEHPVPVHRLVQNAGSPGRRS